MKYRENSPFSVEVGDKIKFFGSEYTNEVIKIFDYKGEKFCLVLGEYDMDDPCYCEIHPEKALRQFVK